MDKASLCRFEAARAYDSQLRISRLFTGSPWKVQISSIQQQFRQIEWMNVCCYVSKECFAAIRTYVSSTVTTISALEGACSLRRGKMSAENRFKRNYYKSTDWNCYWRGWNVSSTNSSSGNDMHVRPRLRSGRLSSLCQNSQWGLLFKKVKQRLHWEWGLHFWSKYTIWEK